jgi:adenosylhomocysteine nucleosidase
MTVEPALGLIVALASEGRALLGSSGWLREGGRTVRRLRLPDGTRLLCARGGVGVERGMSAARWLVVEGATALAVLGISGGLDPTLRIGDLVVAETIIERREGESDRVWETDAAGTGLLYDALASTGLPLRRGGAVTAAQAVLTTADKCRLHERSRALVVDMECAAVAQVASDTGLPLVVLRAVCDTADRPVPAGLLTCLCDDGTVSPFALVRRLAVRPSLVCDSVRTARAFFAALGSLKRAWRALNRAGLPARFASGSAPPRRSLPEQDRE